MQYVTGNPIATIERKSIFRVSADFFYQGLVLSIAIPLAFLVMIWRGFHQVILFLGGLSFRCCVWVFLGAIMLLFLLVVLVQLAVASMG